MSLQQFRAAVVDSGVMCGQELEEFEHSLPAEERPSEAPALARSLVEHRRLTKYQAAHLYQSNALPLVLGSYVILDKIGAGGMGRVYKARHRRLDRLAAIKLLPPEVVNSQDAVRRFQQEVKVAARLTHPNIVITYDADEQHGLAYLVMEYVSGKDLASIVKKEGPLPVELAIECIQQAAQGLAYAHERGVIHRDIKPANLLLVRRAAARNASRRTIKLLDMGLASISSAGEGGGDGLTRTGQIMGSVDYMAPEQALDTRAADARSDIYSLGCTLYVLLVGKIPYYDKSMMKRLTAHRDRPTPDVRDVRPDVPATLADLCQRMMAKGPPERPQSMQEVIELLDACGSAAPDDAPVDLGKAAPQPPPRQRTGDSDDVPRPPPRMRDALPIAAPPIAGRKSAPSLPSPGDEFGGSKTLASSIADPTAAPAPPRVSIAHPPKLAPAPTRKPWLVPALAAVVVLLCGALLVGWLLFWSVVE